MVQIEALSRKRDSAEKQQAIDSDPEINRLRGMVASKRVEIEALSKECSALKEAQQEQSLQLQSLEETAAELRVQSTNMRTALDIRQNLQEQSSLLSEAGVGNSWTLPESPAFDGDFRLRFQINHVFKNHKSTRDASFGECGLEFLAQIDTRTSKLLSAPKLIPIIPPVGTYCRPTAQKFWSCLLSIATENSESTLQSCSHRNDIPAVIAHITSHIERLQTLTKELARIRSQFHVDLFARECKSGQMKPFVRVSVSRLRRPNAQVVLNFDVSNVMNYPKCTLPVECPFVEAPNKEQYVVPFLQEIADSSVGFGRMFRTCQKLRQILN